MGGALLGAASLILIPVAIGMFGFVAATALFVIWKALGSNQDFETAYRCFAYGFLFPGFRRHCPC